MIYLLAAVLLCGLMFYPQYATRRILRKHSQPRSDFPGTGGEFARHLLERFSVHGVGVEPTEVGDHYDPQQKMVRLSPEVFDGRSLTSVVVAAHEVGHAIQDHQGSGGLRTRYRLAVVAQWFARGAQAATILLPLATVNPGLMRLALVVILVGVLLSTLVHLVTLPVEWDASFNKALPILQEGRYLAAADMLAARKILQACAFTYVSASLGSLLGALRWIRWLR
ncbi:zinc metallopeptidase [Ketobacter sp.]|uniref:zinc metallopeptidase n=1 Tax=Ketobacter sp. TaxID=2083498 RepID=UPI000F2267A5|nr:zinc metallopeptidase [Ketobacter sp.]RLU01125.1 MAG: zinc metallopeptidase [Ketobacter sp.]